MRMLCNQVVQRINELEVVIKSMKLIRHTVTDCRSMGARRNFSRGQD